MKSQLGAQAKCLTDSFLGCTGWQDPLPDVHIERVIFLYSYTYLVLQALVFSFSLNFLPRGTILSFLKKSHLIPPEDIWLPFFRLEVGKSYFDTLPVDVQDEDVTYSSACLCQKKKDKDVEGPCQSVFKAAFPTLVKQDNMTPMNPKHASPSSLCDRDKRDIHHPDDITDEDLQLYKQTLHLHSRFKRSVAIKQIPKENATRYCATRISDTELGKLCAKIGVNVQLLVDTCSADVEVSQLL